MIEGCVPVTIDGPLHLLLLMPMKFFVAKEMVKGEMEILLSLATLISIGIKENGGAEDHKTRRLAPSPPRWRYSPIRRISQVHGEVTDPNVDTFDREKVFIEAILAPLVQKLPGLKIVMEHITTLDAIKFVESCPEGSIAATVTPQHLLLNRNSLFQGGLQPHNYCLPVLKREKHRQAIVAAVTSGSKRFFLGTDSAPHERQQKECSCGCAGIYSAPVALSLYAKVFEQAGALDKLEAFASFNGPDFYGLPRNNSKIVLRRSPMEGARLI
ncbi:uncharacterized protein A4U43_C05F29800 [Asparagus officinalis]|uniref:dihydroorotase n=1 Tax=Asparagus officinalis TaxID=4686 RepID=A0A5P1EXY7_ASPOF|nr:uncharacterized protein A4U43_C05F29800 [Asparagus officinalis]